jgi:ABC-type uncharacterized transport system substrate-binding protein
MHLPNRIHILGASGSSTTSLAALMARRCGHRHLDTDDFFRVRARPGFACNCARWRASPIPTTGRGCTLTGIHGQSSGLAAKRLELLKEMVPRLRRVVAFYRPDSPAAQQSVRIAREAARRLKLELVERPVGSVEELRAGLRALRPGEVDAILYVADVMVASQMELIIESARAKRLPTMAQERGSVVKGALAAYGESFYTIGRLSAKQVQRVLLGADPGGLPVEQVDRFHFVVNLRTAKALGLTIPQSLLTRADEVIE